MDKQASRRAFLGAAASPLFGAPSRIRLRHLPGQKVSFLDGGRLLFEFRYAASVPKTYIHPLCAPDGAPITLDSPADHVHHRGLMLAWSDVNGFDFWGETNPGRHGSVVHVEFQQIRERPDAQLTSLEHWIAGGRLLLVERRTLRVPVVSAGAVWLEWTSDLEAVDAPVTLSAKDHVYNGLGVRFIRSMDGGAVLNANGTSRIEAANGEPASWCAYQGRSERGGMAGAVIFGHPSNPRHPAPFFVMNKPFGYLSAAPTFREPFELHPGRPLRLRYAVLSFLGEAGRARIDGWYQRWLSC